MRSGFSIELVIGVTALGWAAGGCRSPAVDLELERSRPPNDIVVTLQPYFRDLMTVSVRAGPDTLRMLFDTGGGATLLAPASARHRGCLPYGRDVGHRMSGEAVVFQRCEAIDVDLGGWRRRLGPVAVFEVNALLPPQLPRLNGVLALDALRDQVVTIDWPGRQLRIHGSRRGHEPRPQATLPYRAATGETGGTLTVLVPVEGRRGALWSLLDSGNLRGTLVAEWVIEDSLLTPSADSTALVRIGGRRPWRSRVVPAELILDGVLGTSFFANGPITLDLRRR